MRTCNAVFSYLRKLVGCLSISFVRREIQSILQNSEQLKGKTRALSIMKLEFSVMRSSNGNWKNKTADEILSNILMKLSHVLHFSVFLSFCPEVVNFFKKFARTNVYTFSSLFPRTLNTALVLIGAVAQNKSSFILNLPPP